MKRRHFAFLLLLVLVFAPIAVAQPEVDPIEAGRDALRDSHYFPWYDREIDDVRRVDVFPEKEKQPPPDPDKPPNTPPTPSAASGWGAIVANLITVFFWLLVAVILATLVLLVIWVFVKMKSQTEEESTLTIADASSDVDRVESLPFNVAKPKDDLLAEARRHYEAGNLHEAIVYLFSYQLVHLDKNQLIHLTKGKTNRQYLMELSENSMLLRLLRGTMITFEDVFFGNHDLERPRFEDCWRRLDEFHHLVAQGAMP